MGKLLRWVTATHSLRYHAHYHTRGEGHIYQARYKSFPVQEGSHFSVFCLSNADSTQDLGNHIHV